MAERKILNLTLFNFCFVLLLIALICSCATLNGSKPIVIPFTIENNRMVIIAEVNGVEGRYIWDKGAFDTCTFVPLENLTLVPEIGSQVQTLSYYIEDGIIIDGQIIKSKSKIRFIPSLTHPQWEWLAPYLKDEGFDGILGIAVFNGWWVEISFSTSCIILHRQKPQGFPDYAASRTTFQGLDNWRGGWYIIGTIDGVPTGFLLDTGAYSAFVFPHSTREHVGSGYRKIITTNDFFYEVSTNNISLMADVFYDKTITTTGESFGEVVVGLEFLRNYDVLFDMRALRSQRTRLYYKQHNVKYDIN